MAKRKRPKEPKGLSDRRSLTGMIRGFNQSYRDAQIPLRHFKFSDVIGTSRRNKLSSKKSVRNPKGQRSEN